MEKIFGKSWRTGLFGAGGLGTIAWNIVSALMDGDPATVVNWEVTIPAVIVSCALLFTRDNKVTSEDVGAKPKE
jgi:hypothetical protein